jgi:cyclopropane fatty-acyl-phospholipid synthase-like methyltransferase
LKQEAPICLVCGSPTNFYCSKDRATYFRCNTCELIFQHPMITLQEMLDYADKEYSEGGVYKEYVDAKELKYATFRQRMKRIRPMTKGSKLLDLGCACGYFIDVALEAGFDAYGVEFSPVAISYASDLAKPRIFQGDVNQLGADHQSSYDVISAYDILEHTLEPFAFLHQLRELLVPNGLLVITTPDTHHFLRPLMKARWPMLQPYQHTYLFSAKSLQIALEKSGYHDIQIVAAQKILTPDYLAEQVRSLNPTLSKLYNTAASVFPSKLRNLPIGFYIGEIMAFARCKD